MELLNKFIDGEASIFDDRFQCLSFYYFTRMDRYSSPLSIRGSFIDSMTGARLAKELKTQFS